MEDAIITLEVYKDPALAHIIRTRLEANEIPCFIADDNMIGINLLFNQALGGIKRKIFERDLVKCRVILSETQHSNLRKPLKSEKCRLIAPIMVQQRFDALRPRQTNSLFGL